MLGIKKKKEVDAAAATAAAAAAATTASAEGTENAAVGAGGGAGGAGGETTKKVGLFGGDDARKTAGSTPGSGKKKMTPGEIRIQRDLGELDGGSVGKISIPDLKDPTSLLLTVSPEQGMWKGATFIFSIKIPDMYPHHAPKVLCQTKIYHPNIDLEGHVCLNILRDEWKPIFDLNTVTYGIIYLFYEPNPNDPLNHEAAALFRDNKASFERNVFSSLRGGRVGAVTFPKLL